MGLPVGLLDGIDESVDSVLGKLRSSSEERSKDFHVVAVGFSCVAMNLIAVDGRTGDQIGEGASISYACNTEEASEECKELRNVLGKDGLDKLYQATGAPLHSAYAIPQLRALYGPDDGNPRNALLGTDHKWQTIASCCIARWTGHSHLPISYSEASWTGLLNVQKCIYEESALLLLPPACRRALPALADFTDCIQGLPQALHDGTPNPYGSRFPELRNARLYLGLGDGACANVARPNRELLSP
jgi:gluconokinase